MNMSYENALNLAYRGLQAAGIAQAAAFETAQFLVLAEADGLASHGLARVSQYAGHARHGRIDSHAKVSMQSVKTASVLVDANDGLAFPALRLATDVSVNLASRHGVGLVAVKNTHHFGVAGHYTEAAARAGFISILMGNTPAAMPMAGGKKALFGTNPLAAAFPLAMKGIKNPLVIDMSLSAVARGKLLVAANKGETIPEGWALNSAGKPTTDPKEGLKGLMLPVGGDKGALLALIIELLVVTLSGSQYSFEADTFFSATGNKPKLGQFLLSIDIGLAGKGVYQSRIRDLIAAFSEDAGIRLPGERRFKQRQLAFKNGLVLSDSVVNEIQAGIASQWAVNKI